MRWYCLSVPISKLESLPDVTSVENFPALFVVLGRPPYVSDVKAAATFVDSVPLASAGFADSLATVKWTVIKPLGLTASRRSVGSRILKCPRPL